MKILIPSSVFPNKKSLRTLYISAVMKSLKKTTNLDLFRFVYQPDRFESFNFSNSQVLDIHNFNNAMDCLKEIKPDCVMISSSYEPIQYALSLSCKKLKIPLISFYYSEDGQSNLRPRHKKIFSNLQNILSSGVPTDSEKQKFFLRRLKFILFKIKFLKKTEKFINKNSNFKRDFFRYFNDSFVRKNLSINELPDLHLVPDPSFINFLKNLEIPENKLCVTGNPFLDRLFEISKTYTPKKITPKKISILIITDALVEHGLWNKSNFKSFLTILINELSKKSEFIFSFKIHPASENKTTYKKLFTDLNINSKIYQNEDVWDVIKNYDVVLTFGYSTIHYELSLIGVKTILLDFNFNFPMMTFVKEGIKFGNIIKCTKIDNLNEIIVDFMKKKQILNESFISTREKFLYKFDGNSGKRCSQAILEFLKVF